MATGEDGKNSDEGSSRSLSPQVEGPSTPATSAPRATPSVIETIVVLNVSPRRVKRVLFVLLLVVFLPFAIYTAKRQYHFHIFNKALSHLIGGHGALAAEILDPWREDFVSSEQECDLILDAYTLGSWMERLQWAAEACAANGVNTASVHMATARFLIANGELDEAERALYKATFLFRNAKAAVMLAHLYIARHKDEEAINFLDTAMINIPGNPTLVLHAVEISMQLKNYLRADIIAEQNWSLRSNREEPDLERVFAEAVTRVGKSLFSIGHTSNFATPPLPGQLPQQQQPQQQQQQQQPFQMQAGSPQPPPVNQASGQVPINLPPAKLLRGQKIRSGTQSGSGNAPNPNAGRAQYASPPLMAPPGMEPPPMATQ